MSITQEKLELLNSIIVTGASHASTSLTKWFSKTVHIEAGGFLRVPLGDAFERIEGAEESMVAIYNQMQGEIPGHLLLAFPEEAAFLLVDQMLSQPIGTTKALDPMGISVLQETGNIVSSSFIGSLANSFDCRILPSVPFIQHDIGGAILEGLLVDQYETSNEALILPSRFLFDEKEVSWFLYVMPTREGFAAMDHLMG
jgi:chemotaxis protein CheC